MIDAGDLATAIRLADAAGAAIRPHFRNLDGLDLKSDLSPVTIADRAAEMAMREILRRDHADDGILGEEFEPVAPRGDRIWVLDPIDGTKAFVAGKPLFATLVALIVAGQPVLGVIDQPITGERWIGHAGGTTLQGRSVRARSGIAVGRAVLCATAPEMFRTVEEQAAFGRLRDSVASLSWGGDAYAYGLVACGATDLVVETGLKPFDLAALVPVVAGAGGVITDWQGRPLGLASDGDVLAAGDAVLHRQALALLAG